MQTANTPGPSITKADQDYVEELLEKLFTALPSASGFSPHSLVDTYMLALIGQPINAFRSVIYKLLTGVLDPAIKFVPRPPELANHVRAEAARFRMLNAPRSLPAPHVPNALARMQKRWQDETPIATGISLDEFHQGRKQGRWPIGAVFACILGNVYAGPPASDAKEAQQQKSAAIQRYREKRDQDQRKEFRRVEIETDEQRDYWRQVAGVRDQKSMTAEQRAFRENVEQQVGE